MTGVGSELVVERAVAPWGSAQRTVLLGGWVLALVAVAVAWWGSSGEAVLGDQYRWVGLATAGLMIAGTVSGAWLLAGRRTVGLRFGTALPVPDEAEMADVVDIRPNAVVGHENGSRPVAAADMRYFHRPDCPLTRDKTTQPADRADHLSHGRQACQVCRP
ncbi:MAG: hypothetical protein QOI86_3138 [Actinomycetota bacterium]|jgi:hypothetical protein|nr:hypothetical protein [Actinomycetota bacterium]